MKAWMYSVALLLLALPPARSFDNHDWQLWTHESVEKKLCDDWSAKVEGASYFGDDMSDLFYRHADIGFVRKTAPWFALGLNYRYAEQEKAKEWVPENRPHINGTFYWSVDRLRFSDRNRMEYRMPDDARDYWRYRNKFRVGRPLDLGRQHLEPYLSDEVFIDSEREQLNQNRASAGVVTGFPRGVKLDLHYMLQSSEKNDRWTQANILGVNLSLSF